jgi:hypothetical protein
MGWDGWADVWCARAEKSALQDGDPFKYYLPYYVEVFLIVSFLENFLARTYILVHSSSFQCMLHPCPFYPSFLDPSS